MVGDPEETDATIDLGDEDPGDDVLEANSPSTSYETVAATVPQVVFVNFTGPVICNSSGEDARGNKSYAICGYFGTCGTGCKDFAAYTGDRATVITKLRGYFSAYNVSFTTTRPSSGSYTQVVVTPSYGPNHGVAMLDCGNANRNGMAFVNRTGDSFFASIGGTNAAGVAKAVAHELGHSFGLGHRGTASSASTDHMDVWSRGNYFNAGNTSDSVNCVGGTGKPQDSRAILLKNIGAHP